ncbi:MAG TPA: VacB/RNase II family 3'-5' exoribonuclease [Polyangiaceae bacterium]|nr:VacB/RNase II family 3'-5' exoribonuclease [Polyangiaceae bacterium]
MKRKLPGLKAGPRSSSSKRGNSEVWVGKLNMNPRGFGFVAEPGKGDAYISPDSIGGALHGDRVEIEIVGRDSRGAEGRIRQILERRPARVGGVLRRRGKSAWLEPDDSRIRGPIVIAANSKQGRDGEAAVVSITRFPEFANENPEAELLDVLGEPGDPQVEVAKILLREGVEEAHPEPAVQAAESMFARLVRPGADGRRDLRHVPLPTIDPEDARDHDDAVWVERRGEGYRAYIAIADVSAYVEPGSALDDEASLRGCTIYLPDRAIPMLPSALAADLCSLLPERERLCLCVIADLDGAGDVESFEIVEGIMRSAAMLTYGGVARALGFTEEPPRSAQAEAMRKDLKVLDELARKLRKARLARGALDLDLPEPKLVLDPDSGTPLDVKRRTQDPGIRRAYSMIEELMLLANEVVARFLGERKSPAVYRIHAAPDPLKLERLQAIAEKLGLAVDVDALREHGGVARFLAKIHKHPKKQVLESLLLRSLMQATYDTNNVGHYGLASEAYVHFTSPIRRYPDILVHRAVKHLLAGGKPKTTPTALEALADQARTSSERERRALDIEREVVDLYRTLLMRERVGDILEGSVAALVGSGAFVTLDDPFVEVLVRFESMGPDRYELSEDELSVVGIRSSDRINLGDRVRVKIEDVSILRRTVYAARVLSDEQLEKLADSPSAPTDSGADASTERRGRKRVFTVEANYAGKPSKSGGFRGASGRSGTATRPDRGGKQVKQDPRASRRKREDRKRRHKQR